MAEYDFESELRRKFNQHRIRPSANAWERVQLQRPNKRKRTTSFFFRYAAIALIVFGLFVLYDQQNNAGAIEIVVKPDASFPQRPEAIQPPGNQKPTTPAPRTSTHQLANSPAIIDQKQIIATPINISAADLEQIKIDEITATLELMATSDQQTNEDDLDWLIENARRDLAAGNGLSTPTDPTALLHSSESELNENFRSSVIENLLKHKRIKLALGN